MRVAVVRLSAIGDVVLALPVARSLRKVHPEAEIVWLGQTESAPLLRDHPCIDRTLPFPRRGRPGDVLGYLREVRRERFDLAVDPQGNSKSALVLAATRAPIRWGFARADLREIPAGWASNRKAPRARGPHALDRTLSLCRALGDPAPRPDFGLAPTEAERALSRRALDGVAAPCVALSVGDARDVREWPEDHWVELAALLRAAGLGVLVLAGPRHAERGARIAGRAGVPARAGVTDLRGLLADLTVLREGGGLLVSGDSAPAHLGAAVGLATLVLAGPQDPGRTAPRGPRHRSLRVWDGLPCAPCLKRRCRLRSDPRACLVRLGPPVVARAARAMLDSC